MYELLRDLFQPAGLAAVLGAAMVLGSCVALAAVALPVTERDALVSRFIRTHKAQGVPAAAVAAALGTYFLLYWTWPAGPLALLAATCWLITASFERRYHAWWTITALSYLVPFTAGVAAFAV